MSLTKTKTIEDLAGDGLVDGAYNQYNDEQYIVVYITIMRLKLFVGLQNSPLT